MARIPLPEPSIHISQQQARRFMLAAHGLLPPREKEGKRGVLQVIRDLNAIQFDPIDIVGCNSDLVLQSRVKEYRPQMLDDLLYKERDLIDGWDKMSSIFPVEDWPYFSRHREKMVEEHGKPDGKVMEIAPDVLGKIREDGPQSSLDFKGYEEADWFWGPTRASRVALESLYAMGRLGIHHRENKRRYFDLIENLLSEDLIETPDPNQTKEGYQSWHVWRRVGSLKLAHAHSGEHWGGILGVKSAERREILRSLVEEGKVQALSVDEVPGRVFFIQSQDISLLEEIHGDPEDLRRAAFIAPLDNLLWDRKLLTWLFDFEYAWEVYKPKEKREYGYYVLPVLVGDQFVARVEPVFDKEERCLTIQGWWWEEGVEGVGEMEPAIRDCLADFREYLGAERVRVSEAVRDQRLKGWVER
ncbi:MAG: crosslink repair DNA glycosylase YcaQ family protein [Anaerolineales bacterium]